MRSILAAAICAALAGPAAAGVDLTLAGYPRIVDGDSLEIEGEPIRLIGIDAPERDQTCLTAAGKGWACGEAATAHLAALIDRWPVQCLAMGRDKYRRWLAVCWTIEPLGVTATGSPDFQKAKNLNHDMILGGMAVRYLDATPVYETMERIAREDHRGIWSGTFMQPEDWRRQKQLGDESEPGEAPESDL